jgi:hypothetical protein
MEDYHRTSRGLTRAPIAAQSTIAAPYQIPMNRIQPNSSRLFDQGVRANQKKRSRTDGGQSEATSPPTNQDELPNKVRAGGQGHRRQAKGRSPTRKHCQNQRSSEVATPRRLRVGAKDLNQPISVHLPLSSLIRNARAFKLRFIATFTPGLQHPAPGGPLRFPRPFQFYTMNSNCRFGRSARYDSLLIQAALDGCDVTRGYDFFRALHRQILKRGLGPPEIVQKLVVHNCMNPARERLRRIVCMPMSVNSDQRFLEQVFCFCQIAPDQSEAAAIIRAQVASQPLEKLPIGLRIAVEAGCYQSSKLAFLRLSESVHLEFF